MSVVPTQEILRHAVDERYGVAAINVINDLTMEAVLAAMRAGIRPPTLHVDDPAPFIADSPFRLLKQLLR